MFGLIKKLLGGAPAEAASTQEPPVDYKGFNIVAAPRESTGGWSTEAIITKQFDGESKTHHFIRADKTGSRDGAV